MLSFREVFSRVEEKNLFICENCRIEEEGACDNCLKLSNAEDIYEMLWETEYDERKANNV